MASITYERKINLSAEKVCSILVDYSMAPTPDIKVELLKEGDHDIGGIGATRLTNARA